MEKYVGKSVFGGIAIGKIIVHGIDEQTVRHVQIDNPAQEKERYHQAVETAVTQLDQLYDKALREVGEESAAIFRTHQMMLRDDDYTETVENMIDSRQVNAEYAVLSAGNHFAQMFQSMEDEYMRGREADVRDISKRLIRILSGNETTDRIADEPVIIVADDLAPSETVQLDKELVLSFVNVHGSVNSHTAILARTMGIPALIGTPIPLDDTIHGKIGIVDGNHGCIYVDPDAETLRTMQESLRREQEQRQLLKTWKGKKTETLDGRRVRLYANIGNMKDLSLVLENDAEGIGLFRSEFLYLERKEYPTEEEQFTIYKAVAETMAGKPVIIRTLDIGADKQCDYFELEPEENPALGLRAIRICLTRPELFKTQLRALYRAAAYGNIAIMYPMITGVNEIRRIRKLEDEVKAELTERGVAFGTPSVGIMIETPAAVMVSRELAEEVDFFSIGTNDLTQYTLAIDRQNPKLDEFYDPHHPAVLSMIRMVTENAHAGNIWVGICGELGGDPELTEEFLRMGVDELSVSPSRILGLRKKIMETRL
ncbi:MAG: phosphoenolpyruvate--protein phosphotransferase [Lachnospiraceae bacterium]